jgi:hypothetical protein
VDFGDGGGSAAAGGAPVLILEFGHHRDKTKRAEHVERPEQSIASPTVSSVPVGPPWSPATPVCGLQQPAPPQRAGSRRGWAKSDN